MATATATASTAAIPMATATMDCMDGVSKLDTTLKAVVANLCVRGLLKFRGRVMRELGTAASAHSLSSCVRNVFGSRSVSL